MSASSLVAHYALLIGLAAPAAAGDPTTERTAPSLEPSGFIGMSLDQLPPQFVGDYEVMLDARIGLTSRKQGSRDFAFLFTQTKRGKATSKTIVSVLAVPPYDRKTQWMAFNFDCSSPGREVSRGDAVVAIFEGRGDGPARLGWKIDVLAKRFEPIAGIRCYTFE